MHPLLNQPCDPKTHELAIAIAKRCVWIVQAVLRDEEKGEALREFYGVAREELERGRDEAHR